MALINFTNKEDLTIKNVPEVNKIIAADINSLKDGININEVNISAATSGYKGVLVIADTPTEDGIYTPTEEGTYTNFGNLEYLPSTTDQGFDVTFIKGDATLTKKRVDLNITFDAVPTLGSPNAVTSDGISIAISANATNIDNLEVDVVQNTNDIATKLAKGTYTGDAQALKNDIDTKQDTLTFDTEPTEDSPNSVTSGSIAYHITPIVIAAAPDALNFNGSNTSWNLDVAAGSMSFRFKTDSKNNIAVSKALTDTYNYLILNYTSGDIEIYTNQTTAVNLLKNKDNYFFIGVAYPQYNLFDMRCNFSINDSPNVFGSANKTIHSILTNTDSVSITNSSGVWKFVIPTASLALSVNTTKKNNIAADLTLVTGASNNWIIGDITTGEITTTSSNSAAMALLQNELRYIFIGRINVEYDLFDMRCPFNVNGVKSILLNSLDTLNADIDIDIPILTDTLAFTDSNELPIYKNSLFKFLGSAKKYDVVVESVNTSGKYKRYDIHNPTYLNPNNLDTDTRFIFQAKEKNSKFIYKNITNLIKSVTTGKSGTFDLLTMGDSLTQGNAGISSMPLKLIQDRISSIGATINGVGTFAMDLGEDTGVPPTSAYMGEGRGFWNYKTFVGKDNSPYGNPVSVATGTGATLKFENPFLRLADATDKTNNPTFCFTNSTENAADPDGVSYADNATYTNYYIFDFANYSTVRGVTPDIITIALGTNDWQENGVINIDDEFLSFQIMYTQIRVAFPNIPLLIVPTQSLFMFDQPEWENEMFGLAERIITEIEGYQVTDSNLKTIPIFQHMSRFNSFKTLSSVENINTNSTIKKARAQDVHLLDKSSSREAYMDVFESLVLSIIS